MTVTGFCDSSVAHHSGDGCHADRMLKLAVHAHLGPVLLRALDTQQERLAAGDALDHARSHASCLLLELVRDPV